MYYCLMQAMYFLPNIYCHCASIIDFLANSYFIVQIYHAKSFKTKYVRSLYFNFLLRYVFIKTLKSVVRFNVLKTLVNKFHLQHRRWSSVNLWNKILTFYTYVFQPITGLKARRNFISVMALVEKCVGLVENSTVFKPIF